MTTCFAGLVTVLRECRAAQAVTLAAIKVSLLVLCTMHMSSAVSSCEAPFVTVGLDLPWHATSVFVQSYGMKYEGSNHVCVFDVDAVYGAVPAADGSHVQHSILYGWLTLQQPAGQLHNIVD